MELTVHGYTSFFSKALRKIRKYTYGLWIINKFVSDEKG